MSLQILACSHAFVAINGRCVLLTGCGKHKALCFFKERTTLTFAMHDRISTGWTGLNSTFVIAATVMQFPAPRLGFQNKVDSCDFGTRAQ